ncbi:hypothetical protein Hdeb2414_s0010g00358621 [Helianthus debilis subsp. tardiflorus]
MYEVKRVESHLKCHLTSYIILFKELDYNITLVIISWVLQLIEKEIMVVPIRHVRHFLSYLMINKAEEALRDAMQAHTIINPEWSLAFYLQTAALLSLGIFDKDAHEMLEDAIFFGFQKENPLVCIDFVSILFCCLLA